MFMDSKKELSQPSSLYFRQTTQQDKKRAFINQYLRNKSGARQTSSSQRRTLVFNETKPKLSMNRYTNDSNIEKENNRHSFCPPQDLEINPFMQAPPSLVTPKANDCSLADRIQTEIKKQSSLDESKEKSQDKSDETMPSTNTQKSIESKEYAYYVDKQH